MSKRSYFVSDLSTASHNIFILDPHSITQISRILLELLDLATTLPHTAGVTLRLLIHT